MPRNDRRNAHRYALARGKIRLGWWQGQHFPTISARLRNLSVSGALVPLEEGAVGPAGVKAWICLADQSATHWVQAEVVGVCPELPETPCVVRLKFLDAFPYESFKTAVWDDGLARGKPAWPDADDTPPPCQDESSARATNPVAMTQSERILFFLQLDAENVKSSDREYPRGWEPHQRGDGRLLPCHDGVVDILFLRRMDAHQGLNRLDHALGVANEITVDHLRWQVLDDTSKQACEV